MNRVKKPRVEKGMGLNALQLAALAVAFKRDVITIKRWAKQNNVLLTLPAAQQIIKEYEQHSKNIQTIN